MMKQAIIYTRVSTADQAREGVSLEAQKARAEAWALAQGYTVAGLFTDEGLSGKRADNRPGLQGALEAVCEAKGALVVYSLSRLARSTRDAIDIGERLAKAGADLVSLSESIDTTSAAGKMIFRMLAVLAEFERDLVSERTAAALQHKRSKGLKTGGSVPFGFELGEDGASLLPSRRDAITRARMRELRRSGASWREIADTLNREGIATKTGKPWTWQTARNSGLSSANQPKGV